MPDLMHTINYCYYYTINLSIQLSKYE